MNIVNVAQNAYLELGSPSGIGIPYVISWFVNNVGKLNSFLGTIYSGVSGVAISPELGEDEQVIYKLMFTSHYYQRLLNSSMDAASYDSWIEIEDDGSRIRRTSKTDFVKIYAGEKLQTEEQLSKLIYAYNLNHSKPSSLCLNGLTTTIIGYD